MLGREIEVWGFGGLVAEMRAFYRWGGGGGGGGGCVLWMGVWERWM